MNFKKEPLETRLKLAGEIRRKYPDRLPVIVTPSSKKDPAIEKHKFLCPDDITVGRFQFEVRKHIKLTKEEAIFLFYITEEGKSILAPTAMIMSQLYEHSKHSDDFLYFTYAKENTFG
jgi:hypothetical protein